MILFSKSEKPVKKVSEHKHLGIILDSKLSFSSHIKLLSVRRGKAQWFAKVSLQIFTQAYPKTKYINFMYDLTWTTGMVSIIFKLKYVNLVNILLYQI